MLILQTYILPNELCMIYLQFVHSIKITNQNKFKNNINNLILFQMHMTFTLMLSLQLIPPNNKCSLNQVNFDFKIF